MPLPMGIPAGCNLYRNKPGPIFLFDSAGRRTSSTAVQPLLAPLNQKERVCGWRFSIDISPLRGDGPNSSSPLRPPYGVLRLTLSPSPDSLACSGQHLETVEAVQDGRGNCDLGDA